VQTFLINAKLNLEIEVNKRADWEKSLKETKVRIGRHCSRRRRRRKRRIQKYLFILILILIIIIIIIMIMLLSGF